MRLTRFLPLTAVVLLSGCLYGVRDKVDRVQCDMALHPYDPAPPGQAEPPKPISGADKPATPTVPDESQNTPATDVRTAAILQAKPEKPLTPAELAARRLQVPGVIPGSETPPLDFTKPKPGGKPGERIPMTPAERAAAVKALYPDPPALEPGPTVQPGPGGRPYTLADLQELATRFSPTLKQAISDVQAARGNMLTARAYPNPTLAFEADPSATGLSPTFQGFFLDQPIKTAGKLKLQEAAARKDLENAELALRRARSDLSTQVRNAYFGVLVAWETMRVNRGVARLTDEVYRIQRDLAVEGFAADYEPATLLGQADQARLAYRNSLFAYRGAWRQLVAAVGLRERDMPPTEVAGRVDAFVPIFDYDQVLARVLGRHTDILSARNTIEKTRYNLQLQQITPWFPDVDVQVKVQKDFTTPPGQFVPSVTIAMPLSVWDQNKGNIIAAEAAMTRALDQEHAAELTWTGNLASAFTTYRQNLQALEDYRRRILPYQVRAYRGVFLRRAEVGGGVAPVRTPIAFADLVTAQQALTSSVTTYLGILGTLWSSVVSVADPLQSDDLFQLAEVETLPPIPDLDHLLPLPCNHDCPALGTGPAAGCAPTATPAVPSATASAPAEPAGQLPAARPVPRAPATGPAWMLPRVGDGQRPLGPALPAAVPGPGLDGYVAPFSSPGLGGFGQ
jgi:cobalt-zinc-cadmium efflux system outer membrane protein